MSYSASYAAADRLMPARGQQLAVLPVAHLDRLAGRQRDRRKARIGRRQRRIGVVRHAAEPARERQQPLAGLVEHVFLLAEQILEKKR